MKRLIFAFLLVLTVVESWSATPASERRRLDADYNARQRAIGRTLQEAADATRQYSTWQEEEMRRRSTTPLPNLRIVDGKVYDADKSQLWFPLSDLASYDPVVLETNEAGAVVELKKKQPKKPQPPQPPDSFTRKDGSPVDRGSVVAYAGKVISVTDAGCIVRGESGLFEDKTIFVRGVTGYVDDDWVAGDAVFGTEYQYVAVSGAQKTIRSIVPVVRHAAPRIPPVPDEPDEVKKVTVKNLRRPPGTIVAGVRVLRVGDDLYDCGVFTTKTRLSPVTNSLPQSVK